MRRMKKMLRGIAWLLAAVMIFQQGVYSTYAAEILPTVNSVNAENLMEIEEEISGEEEQETQNTEKEPIQSEENQEVSENNSESMVDESDTASENTSTTVVDAEIEEVSGKTGRNTQENEEIVQRAMNTSAMFAAEPSDVELPNGGIGQWDIKDKVESVHIIVGWYEPDGDTSTRPKSIDVTVYWTDDNGLTHTGVVTLDPEDKNKTNKAFMTRDLGVYSKDPNTSVHQIERWKTWPNYKGGVMDQSRVMFGFPEIDGYIKMIDGDCGVIYIKAEPTNIDGIFTIKKTTTGDAETPKETIFTITDFNTGEVVRTITYDKFTDGEYTVSGLPVGSYKITESNAEVPGYVLTVKGSKAGYNDRDSEVEGAYQENSGPEASVNTNNATKTDIAYLDNHYEESKTSIQLKAQKIFEKSTLQGGEFTFELRDGTVLVSRATNNEKGEIVFPEISYDTKGTYKYTIREVEGNLDNVIYDKNSYDVIVDVSVDEEGKLQAIPDSNYEENGITFHNTHATSVTGKKTWDDQNDLAQGRPESIRIRLYANGKEIDSKIVTKADEWSWEFTKLPKYANGEEIVYAISEDQVVGYTSNIIGYDVTNVYAPNSARTSIQVKKVLSGREWQENDTFTFSLSAADEVTKKAVENQKIKLSKSVSATKNNQNPSFELEFMTAGEYTFVIQEIEGTAAGITYSNKMTTVKYKVYDSDVIPDGTLDAVRIAPTNMDDLIFTNEYKVDPVETIGITALKKVTCTDNLEYSLDENDFSFKLTPDRANPDSDPIKEQTVQNQANGKIAFVTDGKYTEAGTYKYVVSELGGEKGGIVYDSSQYMIVVDVTDLNSENVPTGKLMATMSIQKDGKEVTDIVFENTYHATETSLLISGSKELISEHKSLEDQEFKFEIKAVGENSEFAPLPENTCITNNGSGDIRFAPITYTQPGTYTYEISEVNEHKAGYQYDDTVYKITVKVTDKDENGQETGELKATATGILNDQREQLIVFRNNYVPKAAEQIFGGKKTLEGREQREGEFAFELRDKENHVIQTVKNNADGTFAFSAVSFEKAGTYTFTIVEKNTEVVGVTYDMDTVYQVEVEVTDEGYDGQLDIAAVTYKKGFDTVEANNVVFVNTYQPVSAIVKIEAFKELTGRQLKAEEFEFVLEDEEGNKLEAVNTADGSISFEQMEFTDAGIYKYKLYEKKGSLKDIVYDENIYHIEIVVEDDLNGQLIAAVHHDSEKLIFTNQWLELLKPDGETSGSNTTPEGNVTDSNTTPEGSNSEKTPSGVGDTVPVKGVSTGDSSTMEFWFLSTLVLAAILCIMVGYRRAMRYVQKR